MPKKISDNIYILDYIMYEKNFDVLLEKINSFHRLYEGEYIPDLRNRPHHKNYDKYIGIIYGSERRGSVGKTGGIGIFLPLVDETVCMILLADRKENWRIVVRDGRREEFLLGMFTVNKKSFKSLHEILIMAREKKEGEEMK